MPNFATPINTSLAVDTTVGTAAVLDASAPTATLIEAGIDGSGQPVNGVSNSSVTLSKSDADGDVVTYDTTGWTPVVNTQL